MRRSARTSTAIASDAPGVVAYDVRESGRHDLQVRSLSSEGLPMHGEYYGLVQDEHRLFENERMVAQLRRRFQPVRVVRVRGTPVVEVFKVVH